MRNKLKFKFKFKLYLYLCMLVWKRSTERPKHVARVRYQYHILLLFSWHNKLFVLLRVLKHNGMSIKIKKLRYEIKKLRYEVPSFSRVKSVFFFFKITAPSKRQEWLAPRHSATSHTTRIHYCVVGTLNLAWNWYATCNIPLPLQLPVLYCRDFNFFWLDPILFHMLPAPPEHFFLTGGP